MDVDKPEYRVVVSPGHAVIDENGVGPEDYYTFVEVMRCPRDGSVVAVEECYPIGDSVEDLRLDLRWMLEATELPVLSPEELP